MGELAREKTLTRKALETVARFQPHIRLAHFPIITAIVIGLFSILFVFTGNQDFEVAAYHLLLVGFISSPPALASGFLSWKVTYKARMTNLFRTKIKLGILFLAVITVCFVWRIISPNILTARTPLSYLYLAFLLSLSPIAVALGYYGGKIVHA